MDPGQVLEPSDIDRLAFDKGSGLLPAIVQDVDTGAVLMLGYMNREALHSTFQRRRVVFFSRSKQRLWMKGETSGHYLDLIDVRTDCDRDTLLITSRPLGPACHVGTATCFGDEPVSRAEQIAFLLKLESIITQRMADNPEGSYTARLFADGPKRIAQKVGEEGVEVALASITETDDKLVSESADLLFHLLVLLKSRGIGVSRVVSELQSRHKAR